MPSLNVFVRGREKEIDTDRRAEGSIITEAEAGVGLMQSQSKKHHQPAESG